MFWSDKTDVCVAVNSSQAAKWVWCYITLHFSSFYFTVPPAPDEGTWPKQLHSNNLEHLSLICSANTKRLTLSVCTGDGCVCVHLFQGALTCSLTSNWGWGL